MIGIFFEKRRRKQYQKYLHKWRCGGVGIIVMIAMSATASLIGSMFAPEKAVAASCPELMIVFARGSGAEKNTNDNFLEFKRTIETKISGWGISREYVDLDYDAIGIGDLSVLAGAFFGAGEAYSFGESVNGGIERVLDLVQECADSRFVLGGYSQGAMVISKAIQEIDASRIVYTATFGDPKIYLPEGKAIGAIPILGPLNGTNKNLLRTGVLPDACKGKNLSAYRMYVPDCYAYEGMLGSYRPYQPSSYSGKLGTWCNTKDMFCSSYLSASSHTSYVRDGLYEDASRVIANKIAESFDIEDKYTSPHDTAILIDSTGSMSSLISQYKKEALNLAQQTLEKGGRVALFDYRDISDGYEPNERCNFETCSIEKFKEGLEAISANGGGDAPESFLSASFGVMKKLDWKYGATKSVVVLTDASYHNPDLDGTTFDEVVKLSKSIDPVNFYIITPSDTTDYYNDIAAATGGAVVSSSSNLALLTGSIIERYDSLPRVEEEVEFNTEIPALTISDVSCSEDVATVRFLSSGERVAVALNDTLMGTVDGKEVVIDGINHDTLNVLRLTPLTSTRRGESVEVEIDPLCASRSKKSIVVPKAPNTGKFMSS